MITISVCMIVKNEERNLKRCLDSLTGIADEIIIVDTGSTDDTKKIAKQYTDFVYDYAWKDDFADARNYSISKATMEYIYFADADEYIDEINQTRFAQMKQVFLPEIDIVQMKYCNQLEFGSIYNFDEEYRPKLIKRQPSYYFVNPIHEIIQFQPVIYDSEIEIIHKPHESHTKRDLELFQKIIRSGHRLSKHLIDMYAKELFIGGTNEDIMEAYDYFKEVLNDDSRDEDELSDARCVVVKAARLKGEIEIMFGHALKAMALNPPSEICYEIGEYYFEKGMIKEAMEYYDFAMNRCNSQHNIHYSTTLPKKRLEECEQLL